jgi:3-hydroxyisobutyrate dehydrogenase
MGTPMALRLVGAGVPLVVWNRTASRATPLQAAGAHVVDDVAAVFAAADVVLLMLADASAVDAVLQRGTPRFTDLVAGRLVISTGTVAPEHSEQLAADIARAGGSYVEGRCPGAGCRPSTASSSSWLPGASTTLTARKPSWNPSRGESSAAEPRPRRCA